MLCFQEVSIRNKQPGQVLYNRYDQERFKGKEGESRTWLKQKTQSLLRGRVALATCCNTIPTDDFFSSLHVLKLKGRLVNCDLIT